MVQRLTELLDHEAKEASELQVSDGGWGWMAGSGSSSNEEVEGCAELGNTCLTVR